ncbi:MAG: hypothetical protein JNL60_11195 [Bacteroidia bacterium]|nr:hypothetical protein [Bacteroidia bacterium]
MKTKLPILLTFLCAIVFLSNCKKKDSSSSTPTPTPTPVVPTPTVVPTNTGIPTVLTSTVINITDSSAVSGGTVTKEGASVILAVGIVFDEAPNPTLLKNKTTDGAGIGNYTSKMGNLKPNTTYYVRAYASNVTGTAYGDEISFKTQKSTKWQGWGNGIPFSTFIRDFASIGNDLFAAGTNGIFKSSNGDNNWTKLGLGTSSGVSRMINKNGVLIAGTEGAGIYVSTDGGSNWSQSNTGLSQLNISDMAISGNNIIAVAFDYVYLSTDNGANWSDITPTIPNALYSKVACIGNSVFVYDYNNAKIYLTQDNGSIWNPITDVPQQPMVLCLKGIDSDLYSGSFGGLHRSSDNGGTWSSTDYGMGTYAVYSLIKSGNTMYAGNTQGIYASTNNGANWSKIGTGLPINSTYTTIHVHLGGIYISGSFNNGGVYRIDQ